MPKTLDLCAHYPARGGDKSHYRKVGLLFIKDDGRISMKLDFIPVGPEWAGWLNAFEQRPRESIPGADPRPAPPILDDDIPF